MDQAAENDLNALNELNKWLDGKINGTTGGNDDSSTNELPSTDDTTPYYPDETFTKDPDTNLDNGLVIKDSIGNEYVWIEVPKSLYNNEAYNTETTTADQKPTSSTEYDKIEYCLHKYTDYYRRNKSGTLTSFTDTYYSDDTTGASDECKKMNIYNLSGNVAEWTLEYTSDIGSPCAPGGGSYNNHGALSPASCRDNLATTSGVIRIGFRPSLYK